MGKHTTHGAAATHLHEVDLEEKDFLVGPHQQIIPCSRAGAVLTRHVTAKPGMTMLPNRLQRELDGLAGFLGIVDMQREADVPFYAVTKAGSTTTAIKIQEPVLPNISAAFVVYVLDPDTPRPPYIATSISGGDTVNIPAMSEAAPAAGVAVIIRYPPKPRPRAADFPNPSFGFKIGADWFVYDCVTREISGATLSAGELVPLGSPSTCDLTIGAIPGDVDTTVNHLWRGDHDFSGATVTGLGGGGGLTEGQVGARALVGF